MVINEQRAETEAGKGNTIIANALLSANGQGIQPERTAPFVPDFNGLGAVSRSLQLPMGIGGCLFSQQTVEFSYDLLEAPDTFVSRAFCDPLSIK